MRSRATISFLGLWEKLHNPDFKGVDFAPLLSMTEQSQRLKKNTLGAAKTSACYAVAPFVGAFLSFLLLKEGLSWIYLAALAVMVAGAALVVIDTLVRHHTHPHQHTFTHFHGGCVHTHTITHIHGHDHFMTDATHAHRHPVAELERAVAHNPAADC